MTPPPPPQGGTTNVLTRSTPFRMLVHKAFAICDSDQTGHVCKAELYAGLLLVHLNLAKYAGPAACYPPTRVVVDQLFDAADADHSGTIDRNEFIHIVGITCAQILGRMMVYYLLLILLVPMVAARGVHQWADTLPLLQTTYGERAAEQVLGMTLFFWVIPILWNTIDQYSSQQGFLLHPPAATTSPPPPPTTTTTPTPTPPTLSIPESSKEE